ncbi:hypothetical protein ACIBCT_39455 [Streptosporangium sp. NPDC050855]|uniref:hypothetical protein n=1 Tax=Streptosporangium sp. NPDC050855 TaxID=3366194 RepID=UPI003797D8BA
MLTWIASAVAAGRVRKDPTGDPLYDEELYRGWHRYTLEASTSQGGQWESRTEVLWSNRPLNAHEALFDPRNETPAPNPTPAEACNETLCEAPECGLTVRQPATGRRRRYCSTACRVRAHRMTTRS